ncbi:hypothetical protein AVDCRST_MAG82-584, partial [uncultured Rubrobacteraceae bacterium]
AGRPSAFSYGQYHDPDFQAVPTLGFSLLRGLYRGCSLATPEIPKYVQVVQREAT